MGLVSRRRALLRRTHFCCAGWPDGGGATGFIREGPRAFFLYLDGAGGLGNRGRPTNTSNLRMAFRTGAGRTITSQNRIPKRVMPTMVQSRFIAFQ